MIADLKPYAEYKESGLPWLGRVPEHWGSRRMKFLFMEQSQKGFPKEPLLAATQSKGVVRKEDYGSRTVTAMNGLENLKLVEVGDFVISLRSFQGGIEVSHARGIISPAYTVLRPRGGFEPGYYKAYFKSPAFINSLTLFVTGIREGQNIDYERLSRAFMPLPPVGEQAVIVRFLDWANGRLERTIRAKQKVIALLNEQKQAIIHRSVTRGLNPSAPLKPSGIPWLGEVPAHWELTPNRAFLGIRKVLVGKKHNSFTLLSLTKRGVIVRDLSEMRGKFSSDMGTSQEVRPGDLVLCLFDVPETPRTVGLSHHAGMITGAYTVMECKSADIAQFLEIFYIAMDDRKLLSPLYSGLRNTIPKERFLGAKTPIPPAGERAAILSAVKEQTFSLDMAISRLKQEIELLREYRTRLVADVVTGKLDVRAVTSNLPEGEPLDDTEAMREVDDDALDTDHLNETENNA
jgi:type I restriction enzyme S subunit